MEAGDTRTGKEPEMLKHLAYKDLAKMTRNFSKENYIGIFQFGKLYRGFLHKKHFTVKIWTTSNLKNTCLKFRECNLMDELIILSHQRLAHPCIVSLYGYCRDNENLALVYNLKSMDSLENMVLKDDFTWLQRMKVAFELACLLAFFHARRGDLDPFLIRNLSAAHVMLDEEYNPKLVDFSMITGGIFPDRQIYTLQPAYGYFGYWDRDLLQDHTAHLATWTEKSDVFAFGVMLVSLLSKRVMTEEMMGEFENCHGHLLDEWAHAKYEIDKSLIHKRLQRDPGFSYVDGHELSMLAVNCVSYKCEGRPTIMKVINSFLKLQVFNDHKEFLGVDRFVKKKHNNSATLCKLLLDTKIDYSSCGYLKDIARFDSDFLKECTNNFSEENYIGRFQFGKIFRGFLPCLSKGPVYLTVKIWDDNENLQLNFLRQEDEILLSHHEKYTCHPGMVRMYGYCPEDKYVAIVLFFKPMDSVRNLLPRDEFTWLYRIKVAYGVASILKYLHAVSPHIDPFIIRNLDAAHILVDEEYNPKLVDFGMITGGIFPNRPMNVVKSSLECHDRVLPVYDKSGTWTTKSDVHSFGVLLLCLISKRNIEGMNKVVVHKSLRTDSTYNRDDGQGIRRLAVQCLQANPACRPSMLEVVEELQKLKVVESHPGDFVSLDMIPRVNYDANPLNLPKSHFLQHV